MAFWSDIAKAPEPLRQYRWYILFGDNKGNNLDSIRYALMEASKPEVEITVVDHLMLNHTFKYPGVAKWKPMKVKFASVRGEDKSKDAAVILHELVKRGGYIIPIDKQTATINKTDNVESAFHNTISLVQIDDEGAKAEEWVLYNPLITNINYGTLSYSSEDIVTIEATINYDFADLNPEKKA